MPGAVPPAISEISSEPAGWLLDAQPWQPGLSWARGEYLFWYLTGGHVQPLSTTGPVNEPIAVPGFPGRTVLFGDNNPLEDPRSAHG